MPTLMKKANGERLVPDEKVAEYLEMGYSVIDHDGKVLKKPAPTTPAEYAEIIHDYENIIREKNAVIGALTSKNAMLETALADATKQDKEKSAAECAENASYKAEETHDESATDNSAPETGTSQKGISGTKRRNTAKATEEAADAVAE